jgi:hypothetical protein
MDFDNVLPTPEILTVCNQLQSNFDPNKTYWTIDELYLKIFCVPNLNENSLSLDSFREDMNWIIRHGLITYHEGKLKLDDLTVKLLNNYFNEHRES